LKNRQWKPISTGGYLNTTDSGNRVFPLAVLLHQPPVEIGFHWRLCYINRQWKHPIFTGSCVKITASGNGFPLAVLKPGPPRFFYWRVITKTASDNLWVPQAMSSFLLVEAAGNSSLESHRHHRIARGHGQWSSPCQLPFCNISNVH
jgi:hypothetical protein